jgi:hypothetical protein
VARLAIVAVRDSAVGLFARPFCVPSLAAGNRSFIDEVNRRAEDNQMNRHPEDFELFHLGEYDEESGKFFNLDSPYSLSRAKDVLAA